MRAVLILLPVVLALGTMFASLVIVAVPPVVPVTSGPPAPPSAPVGVGRRDTVASSRAARGTHRSPGPIASSASRTSGTGSPAPW